MGRFRLIFSEGLNAISRFIVKRAAKSTFKWAGFISKLIGGNVFFAARLKPIIIMEHDMAQIWAASLMYFGTRKFPMQELRATL